MQFSVRSLTIITTAIAVMLSVYLFIERSRQIDQLVGLTFWLHFTRDLAIVPVSALCVTVVYANAEIRTGNLPYLFRTFVMLVPLVAGLNIVVGVHGQNVVRVLDTYRWAVQYRYFDFVTILGHFVVSVLSGVFAMHVYSKLMAVQRSRPRPDGKDETSEQRDKHEVAEL